MHNTQFIWSSQCVRINHGQVSQLAESGENMSFDFLQLFTETRTYSLQTNKLFVLHLPMQRVTLTMPSIKPSRICFHRQIQIAQNIMAIYSKRLGIQKATPEN